MSQTTTASPAPGRIDFTPWSLACLDRRGRSDRAHHVRERGRYPGGIEDEPDDRPQRDQRGEDREHAVVGQRGGAVGELVLLELSEGALERLPERALASVGR